MDHTMAERRVTDRRLRVWPARFEQIPKRDGRWGMVDFQNGPGPRFETVFLSSFGKWARRWGRPI
jgi:hypothetical protein